MGKVCFLDVIIGVLFSSVVIGVVLSVVDIIRISRLLCSVDWIFYVSVSFRLVFRLCLWNLLNMIVLIFGSLGLVWIMWVRIFLVMILILVLVMFLLCMW